MLKIKDYLVLKGILEYLIGEREEALEYNNGHSNNVVYRLNKMIDSLESIIKKLESEE